jgi:hypothetical protein
MRNGPIAAAAATLTALVAGAILSACAGETVCEYRDRPPSGDDNADIVGCWQGIGRAEIGQDPAYLVVYQYAPLDTATGQGPFREVQSPNRIFSSGNEYFNVWQIGQPSDGGMPLLSMGGDFPVSRMDITDKSLVLDFLFQDQAQNILVLQQPLRRAVCSGYGFEEPADRCPDP